MTTVPYLSSENIKSYTSITEEYLSLTRNKIKLQHKITETAFSNNRGQVPCKQQYIIQPILLPENQDEEKEEP